MANLIITSECNGSCPFCFARNYVKNSSSDKNRITLPYAEKIASFCEGEHVKLLGGEPTLHPEILGITDLFVKKGSWVDIVTNFMGETKTYESLLDSYKKIRFLVNLNGSEYCDDKNLKEKFKQNIQLFKKKSSPFLPGCTIFSANQNFDYILSVIKEDKGECIESLRISPSVPVGNNDFVVSQEIGKKIRELAEKIHAINPKIELYNDCPCLNYCMFSKEDYEDLRKTAFNMEFCAYCLPPLEIFHDGSAIFGFCLQNEPKLKIDNIFNYRNIHEVKSFLAEEMKKISKQTPLSCDFEKCGKTECKGPCLAFNNFMRKGSSDGKNN